jgi:hypothetical protein
LNELLRAASPLHQSGPEAQRLRNHQAIPKVTKNELPAYTTAGANTAACAPKCDSANNIAKAVFCKPTSTLMVIAPLARTPNRLLNRNPIKIAKTFNPTIKGSSHSNTDADNRLSEF